MDFTKKVNDFVSMVVNIMLVLPRLKMRKTFL